MQMLFAAMLIDAFHSALKNAVEIFDGVCVHVATNVFIGFMADALVAREVIAEREIMPTFVRHHRGFFCNIRLDDRDYISRACAIDMERTRLLALAINKRQYRVLMAVAATLNRAFLAADECFINFNNATNAAHRCEIV